MNPLNIMRELLKMFDVGHAHDADRARVALEAMEILADPNILSHQVFQPAAAHLLAILKGGAPHADAIKAGAAKPIQEWGERLKGQRSLIDAFGRELDQALKVHYVPKCIEWLTTRLRKADEGAPLSQIQSELAAIESVTDMLLSALINRGWSFESLFTLYRGMLLPVLEADKASAHPLYSFQNSLASVFARLTAPGKPYLITFAVSNVTKPTDFPRQVGDIAFSMDPPPLLPNANTKVQGYLRARGNRLFATVEVHAEDGRIAGAIASDKISQVLDIIRYDYERKNVQLADRFLVQKPDKQMLMPLPGTIPNPTSSLTPAQLQNFMDRLRELVAAGALREHATDRIFSAFRLYRIGDDLSSQENKLVNWWTALEFLVKGNGGTGGNIGDGVENSLAPTITLSYLPKHLAALRSVLVDLQIQLTGADGNQLELGKMTLVEFYELLQDQAQRTSIETACTARPYVWHRARKFLATVSDPKKLGEALTNHERRLRWHVQRIYRARCDIVHSANRIIDATLLCANLQFYLKTILSAFLEALHLHPTLRSPQEFFDRQKHGLGSVASELGAGHAGTLKLLLARKDQIAAATA
ncbi:hypothetical protein [Ralstonia chuxiongensis]|uniref:hypothetical protein n=1 Tax=Ralstonia chuxiongensis TaxID=2957504 RepID=UPI0028F599EF|nr:hypothetical protein [Ralstonia chuxiongensis]CAJ0784662.1 hypothetical protein R8510_05286 [Ralstonia chuxiongensis]